ncbi:MAG: FmdB family zinc ribbon protein [Vicinamibacterales bacterium]
MPLYEYECDSCSHRFEVIQKFSDAPIEKCPACGSSVHKLMSSPAIQFKGSGWYITDYAKKESTSATKAGAAKDGSTSGEASGTAGSSTPAPAPASTTTKTD